MSLQVPVKLKTLEKMTKMNELFFLFRFEHLPRTKAEKLCRCATKKLQTRFREIIGAKKTAPSTLALNQIGLIGPAVRLQKRNSKLPSRLKKFILKKINNISIQKRFTPFKLEFVSNFRNDVAFKKLTAQDSCW